MREVPGCSVQSKLLRKSLHLPGTFIILVRGHRDHLGTAVGYSTNTLSTSNAGGSPPSTHASWGKATKQGHNI